MMVPYAIEELRSRGVKEKDIQKVVWDTPFEFFSKSGRFKL